MSKVPGDAIQQKYLDVEPRKGESGEKLIRRFTKKVRMDGILREFSQRTYFEKPSIVRRRKKNSAKWNAKQGLKNRKTD